MSIDFTGVKAITTPDGSVKKITRKSDGVVLWIGVQTISAVPSISGTYTYTGSAITPTWSNYDSNQLTIGGAYSATNAGTYNATFTPKTGYQWSDGTTTAKTVQWTINKAAGSLSINPTSITLGTSNTSKTITVTRAGNGAITATSSNTNICTVSVSGNIITVNSVNNNTGTATITVSVAAGTNHYAPSNKTCSVSALFLPAKDTLQNMSWADIQKVSKAGKASEYWAIGDTKTTSVNIQQYTFEIIGFDHDTPTDTSSYGRSKAGITFQMRDLLSTTYTMNSTGTNSGGWKDSSMRSTLNNMCDRLYDVKSFIVPVNKQTNVGGASTDIETTSDKLFLLTEREVFGTTTYASPSHGTQYAYYKNGGSKIKKKSGSAYVWWLRCPAYSYTDIFSAVMTDGANTAYPANFSTGVSFAFCV